MGGLTGVDREVPGWLRPFLVADYFTHCATHDFPKNEKNFFCIDCVEGPICQMELLRRHLPHRTLQIRRASHVNAVRISDIHKLIDVSEIQAYVINSAKIVFLLSRPQQKVVKGAKHWCTCCGRTIADPVLYCSISCKLYASKAASCHIRRPTSFSRSKSDDCRHSTEEDPAISQRSAMAADHASEMELSFEPSTPIKAELQASSAKRRRIGWSFTSKLAAPSPAEDAVHKKKSASPKLPLTLHTYSKRGQLITGSLPARILPSPWTSETRDGMTTLRMRRRKGTPHRAPLL